MLETKEMEQRLEEVNERLNFAKGWQWNFIKAPTSLKLVGLREHLQKTINIIDKILIDDKIS